MKRFLYIIIALVLSIGILSSCNSGVGANGISLDEFNQLSLDMSYYKVCKLIGGEGELISKDEIEEEDRTRYVSTYRFEGETGGYAEIEFTVYGYKDILKLDLGDYLTGKRQFDLK